MTFLEVTLSHKEDIPISKDKKISNHPLIITSRSKEGQGLRASEWELVQNASSKAIL